MELILYILTFILAYAIGYFRGVVSGYHTKVREEDKSSIVNVKIYKEKGIFLFYDHGFNKFLVQSDDIDDGITKLHEMFDDSKTFVVVKDISCDE